MPQVVVTIDDKTYRMACDEGQEAHLEGLAARFDEDLKGLREAFGAIGDQRLTVMTGIMVMDRLHDAEAKLAEAQGKLGELERVRSEATDRVDRTEGELTARVEETARQIERIATKLQTLR